MKILPAAHGTSGSAARRKVATKAAALKVAMNEGKDLLIDFGKGELKGSMVDRLIRQKNSLFSVFHQEQHFLHFTS